MPPTGEVDAILIELTREGTAETGFSKRDTEKNPKQNLGTLFMYNPELGIMDFSGLSDSKMQIGRWYQVRPDWTVFKKTASYYKSVQAVISADVVKETIPHCETSKTVNETGYRRTYYSGSGMILDVTDEYMFIWHDKLGLISHFSKDLEQNYIHMQVVNFKAVSQCESRHCAFHAVAVRPQYETRFKRLQGSSGAVVKALGSLLYASCRNGDKVILLDNEKRLLRTDSNVGLEVEEVINVVYYKIQTLHGNIYISGFYFQSGEKQEFWEAQMDRLLERGRVTDEDLPENYANAPTSNKRLSDDEYCQLWKRCFQFWNPDQEDNTQWITPFLIHDRPLHLSKISPPPVKDNKSERQEVSATNHVQTGEVFPMPRKETVSTIYSSDEDHNPEEALVPMVKPVQPSNIPVSSGDSLTDVNQLVNSPSTPLNIVETASGLVESISTLIPPTSVSLTETTTISVDMRAKMEQARFTLWRFLSEKERVMRMAGAVKERKKHKIEQPVDRLAFIMSFFLGFLLSISKIREEKNVFQDFMNISDTSFYSAKHPDSDSSYVTVVDNRPPSNRSYHPNSAFKTIVFPTQFSLRD